MLLFLETAKSWFIGKDSDAGRDWGQEEKGTTEDKIAGWHHQLDGHEFGWTPGVWWWTGRPGVLQFMGSQRVRHDWATELNWRRFPMIFRNLYLKLFSFIFRERKLKLCIVKDWFKNKTKLCSTPDLNILTKRIEWQKFCLNFYEYNQWVFVELEIIQCRLKCCIFQL